MLCGSLDVRFNDASQRKTIPKAVSLSRLKTWWRLVIFICIAALSLGNLNGLIIAIFNFLRAITFFNSVMSSKVWQIY